MTERFSGATTLVTRGAGSFDSTMARRLCDLGDVAGQPVRHGLRPVVGSRLL